ncbi:MAG TPA: glycoside hydrolase family 130 protein [Chthoniobacterales bacterium]
MYADTLHLRPDPTRVLLRAFIPEQPLRVRRIVNRALALSEVEVSNELGGIRAEFGGRHRRLDDVWTEHYEKVQHHISEPQALSTERKVLIGALFTGEYSLESAALFNPSIVAAPDQGGLRPNELRFILSLRAVGEGHISSVEFRSGVVRADGSILLDTSSPFVTSPELLQRTAQQARSTAKLNYEVRFEPSEPLSERVLFPRSETELSGIEDARFVRFVDEDGTVAYYGTYTAYDGRAIRPQLIETKDFCRFRIRTLSGPAVYNKGMALFPHRINGRYAMLSRQDDENIMLMHSDDLHYWSDPEVLIPPEQPWEMVKVGNCGSPLQTEAGWLVLTHGVGPVRKYCLGAVLLDLENPRRVLGRLKKPLVEPQRNDWQGYVPNVVYSCGGLIHQDRLILPYGINDSETRIVTFELSKLLAALLKKNDP